MSEEQTSANARASHEQAVTAAELAFERAKERDAASSRANEGCMDTADNEKERPQLGRRQSIRFTGPTAAPRRSRSITRREAPTLDNPELPFHHDQHSDILHSDAKSVATAFSRDVEDFIESDLPSVPSSYRRLRKAKSMFSPGKAPSTVFSNGTPIGRRHFQRQSMQSSLGYEEPLRIPDQRLRRSFSFLRGVTDRLPTSNRQYVTQDAAVQLARDQYLRQLEEQRLKARPYFLNLSKRRRSQKAFRTTVRTSSTNSYGSAIESSLPLQDSAEPKSIKRKARSLSQTLRRKLKQVFGRNNITTMPVQHLDASRPHYGNEMRGPNQIEHHYSTPPSPDEELLRRVSSRESVLRSSPVILDKEYRAGSIRRAPSDDDLSKEKSRVTSWTNSTAANTIEMPHLVERKRLSVIKEDGGPHEPSSSARLYGPIGDGYAVFRQPVRQINKSVPPEPQRVYSALQKEIGRNSRDATIEKNDSELDNVSDQANYVQSRPFLRRSSSAGMVAAVEEGGYRYGHHQHVSTHHQPAYVEDYEGLTPQQIAELNESGLDSTKRPLRETKSAFFPTNMRIDKSDTSPYRRLLQVSSEDDGLSRGRYGSTNLSQPHAFDGRARRGSVAVSESVYSQTSGRRTPMPIGSTMSLPRSEDGLENGTAVIITSEVAKHGLRSNPFVNRRNVSDNSSGEWKKRLASELAYFDDIGNGPDEIYNALPVKESGHKRENAQVDEEDVTVGNSQRPTQSTKQPLGLLLANSNARPPLKHSASHPLIERLPFMDTNSSHKRMTARKTENVPFPQPQVQSRESSRKSNEKDSSHSIYDGRSILRRRYSQASLLPRNENSISPASSIIRLSPERQERLRRLQSKSSLSLHRKTGSVTNPPTQADGPIVNQTFQASSSSNFWHNENVRSGEEQNEANVSQAPGANTLVDTFLKGRRRNMRFSEESGGDPAFL